MMGDNSEPSGGEAPVGELRQCDTCDWPGDPACRHIAAGMQPRCSAVACSNCRSRLEFDCMCGYEEWGEEVVTCYLSDHSHGEASLARWASANLTKHQCPKRFMRFSATEWPLNGQGKVNRAELRRLALSNPSRDI